MPVAEEQLDVFMAAYAPDVVVQAKAALAWLRHRIPGATQIVYNNRNVLVIAFGPNTYPSDAVFSIALYPRWVNLFFLQGAGLPDPKFLLKGEGNIVRSIRIEDMAKLDMPAVNAIVTAALKRADPVFPMSGGKLLIKAKQKRQPIRKSSAPASTGSTSL